MVNTTDKNNLTPPTIPKSLHIRSSHFGTWEVGEKYDTDIIWNGIVYSTYGAAMNEINRSRELYRVVKRRYEEEVKEYQKYKPVEFEYQI